MDRRLRALAAIAVTALLLGLTAVPSQAADRVRLSASDTTPVVGKRVTLTAKVGDAGERVVFQERTGTRWRPLGADRSNRRGVASVTVRFDDAGRVKVRARAGRADDTLRLRVRKARTRVLAAYPPGPWKAGEPVGIAVRVEPAAGGRRVWLERLQGGQWGATSDRVRTNPQGGAVITWTPTRIGTERLRVRVAESSNHKAGASTAVDREVVDADTGLLAIVAPETVQTGGQLDVHFDIATGEQPLTDAVLTVTAPSQGDQVTPPDELAVDPTTHTAVLAIGGLAAGTERRVTLRWQAPATPGQLVFGAGLTAAELEPEQTFATVEVVAGSGGFVFGSGLEATQESREAPGHPDQIFMVCLASGPPSSAPVPTFDAALAAARARIAAGMEGRDTTEWEELEALTDPERFDEMAAIAMTDLRYDGALAASLRGWELDPGDGVHLSNAAAAANMIEKPEWAIAFATEAAKASGASVGVRQEAARLVNLGHAWALKGNFAQAVAALQQAEGIQPDSQVVRGELGAVLACQGNKTAALPHIRRSLRTDDTPDPIELDSGGPESRRTAIETSALYDLSAGVDQELTLPPVPPSWPELIGRGPEHGGGTGYYDREYDAAAARGLDLVQRANDLELQLSQRKQGWAPVQAQRTDDILRRIGTSYDQDITTVWDEYVEISADEFRLNFCDDMFPDHPYCSPHGVTVTCASSQSIFNEWERRLEASLTALTKFHDAAAKHLSGLQSLLSDPVAHELAGVRAEIVFHVHVQSYLANLSATANSFAQFNEGAEELEPGETCLTPAPAEDDPARAERKPAPFCAPDSLASKFSFNLDLEVVSVSVGCEKWSVEASGSVAKWLEAFAKIEGGYNTNGFTVNIGVRAGIGGAGFESGLYYIQTSEGKVKDFGWQVGPEFQPGGLISVDAGEDKQKISFMSLFVLP